MDVCVCVCVCFDACVPVFVRASVAHWQTHVHLNAFCITRVHRLQVELLEAKDENPLSGVRVSFDVSQSTAGWWFHSLLVAPRVGDRFVHTRAWR